MRDRLQQVKYMRSSFSGLQISYLVQFCRCRQFDSKQLMNMVRQRGISLTIDGGEATEYECTVLFLFNKKGEKNVIEDVVDEDEMEA